MKRMQRDALEAAAEVAFGGGGGSDEDDDSSDDEEGAATTRAPFNAFALLGGDGDDDDDQVRAHTHSPLHSPVGTYLTVFLRFLISSPRTPPFPQTHLSACR